MKYLKIILLGFSICFLAIYFCADFLYNPKYVIYIKPFIIPLFLCYGHFENKKPLTIKFYLFALLFYIGDIIFLISDTIMIYLCSGLFFYFLSYLALVNLINPLSGKYKLKNIFGGYTLFIIILN